MSFEQAIAIPENIETQCLAYELTTPSAIPSSSGLKERSDIECQVCGFDFTATYARR